MADDRKLTLYYAPNTRATGVRILLEELGARYELQVLNFKKNEQRAPAYLAVNPMGKVPAVLHGDALVTEQVALYTYLADLYPEAGLAPGLRDPLRGPYLRWIAIYGACFEPALIDRSLKRDPAPAAQSGYGDFDTLFAMVVDQLGRGEYLLGPRFQALDVLWGIALTWIVQFKLIPAPPAIQDYTARINARPAAARVRAWDAELAAQLA